MASVFTRIINGEIPSYKVAEDDTYFAFLDIRPLKEGHVLEIPKQETHYIFDLGDDLITGFQLFAKRVAIAIKKAIPCNRIGVAVLGMEVPHAHIHLVPMDRMSDMNFANTPLTLSKEEMEEIAAKIRKEFI